MLNRVEVPAQTFTEAVPSIGLSRINRDTGKEQDICPFCSPQDDRPHLARAKEPRDSSDFGLTPSSIAKLFRAANAATSTLVVQKSHLVWPIEFDLMRPHRGRPEVALVTAGGSRNVRLWLCRPPYYE